MSSHWNDLQENSINRKHIRNPIVLVRDANDLNFLWMSIVRPLLFLPTFLVPDVCSIFKYSSFIDCVRCIHIFHDPREVSSDLIITMTEFISLPAFMKTHIFVLHSEHRKPRFRYFIFFFFDVIHCSSILKHTWTTWTLTRKISLKCCLHRNLIIQARHCWRILFLEKL